MPPNLPGVLHLLPPLQGLLTLRPGQPEPQPGAASTASETESGAAGRRVSATQYARFNAGYAAAMLLLLPLSTTALLVPFGAAASTALFKLGLLPGLLVAPPAYALGLVLAVAWMALLKRCGLACCECRASCNNLPPGAC